VPLVLNVPLHIKSSDEQAPAFELAMLLALLALDALLAPELALDGLLALELAAVVQGAPRAVG
jgi:hypothetical protein